jgi:uncharacterized protein
MTNFLLLAGIHNSGEDHWQSHWQSHWHKADSRFSKLEHTDWDCPDRLVWVSELEEALAICDEPVVLVAHSLACLMVAHWAASSQRVVSGAFLVSIPDPSAAQFPIDAKHFNDVPTVKFRFPTKVVSSENDPYGSQTYMRQWAMQRGADFVSVGALGHINAASKLGSWPQGMDLLEKCESNWLAHATGH